MLSKGFSKSLADEFLEQLKPTFEDLIYPSFNISLKLPEEESYQEEFEKMGEFIGKNINAYSKKMIGMVVYKDLLIFLMKKKLDGELE